MDSLGFKKLIHVHHRMFASFFHLLYLLCQVCKGPQQHEEASLGLLYVILVDPPAAPKVI